MLGRSREYFRLNNVLEVDTPAMSSTAASDPQIESIAASLSLTRNRQYYLHTSPEFYMKRLLCAGYPDIYQICKVYRDNELGRFHQPEFTLIEWYRLNFSFEQIIEDTLAVIALALDNDLLQHNADRMSYNEAFRQFAGCDAMVDDAATLAAIYGADDQLKQVLGDNREAWLDLLLEEKVMPQFPADKLTVLAHYPVSQAALARQCPSNQDLADRFEVFLGKHELANGYVELTDPEEQARRFADNQQLRASRGQDQRPLDLRLVAAMRNGLPDCAGVAVGVDRLLMIKAGANDIRQIQTFSFAI